MGRRLKYVSEQPRTLLMGKSIKRISGAGPSTNRGLTDLTITYQLGVVRSERLAINHFHLLRFFGCAAARLGLLSLLKFHTGSYVWFHIEC